MDLSLNAALHISTISQVFEQLDNIDVEQSQVSIDLSKISKIDTSGLQLLIAFKEHLKTRQQELILVNPSSEIHFAAELLGVADLLLESNAQEGAK